MRGDEAQRLPLRVAALLRDARPQPFRHARDVRHHDVRPGEDVAVQPLEDEPLLLRDFCSTVETTLRDTAVHPFRWASDALAFARAQQVDIAFLDIELVGGNGLDLARGLKQCNPRCNIIFLTSHPEYAREALELFCSGYVMKPLSPAKIGEQISHLRYPVPGLTVRENA